MDLFKRAVRFFENKEYGLAISAFEKLDNQDNPVVDYYLGRCYFNGLGVEEDLEEAYYKFKNAAEKGVIEAQYYLWLCYYYENILCNFPYSGTKYEEVSHWLNNAVENGYTKAISRLAFNYLIGVGVDINEEVAQELFHRAAIRGDANARTILGVFEEEDNQIPSAIYWYEKAISSDDNGDFYLQNPYINLAIIYKNKKSPYYNPEKAIYYLKKLIEKTDNKIAYHWLGRFYHHGVDVPNDLEQAFMYYMKGAECGDQYCILKLARFYKKGIFVSKNMKEAIKLYKRLAKQPYGYKIHKYLEHLYACGEDLGEEYNTLFRLLFEARKGNLDAQIEFGYKYLKHDFLYDNNQFIHDDKKKEYIEMDYAKEAYQWYAKLIDSNNPDVMYLLAINPISKDKMNEAVILELLINSANLGNIYAKYELAMIYRFGKYTYKDVNESIKWYMEAAESLVDAQLDLGYFYAHGLMVQKDYSKALYWYNKALPNINLLDSKKLEQIRQSIKYNITGNKNAIEEANKGNEKAKLYLSFLYKHGFEVKKNIKKEKYWKASSILF